MNSQAVQPKLIPFLDAIKSIPLCRNTALKHAETGLMPRPIRLGSKLFFKAQDWDMWIDSGCAPIETNWRPKRR